LLRRHVPEPSQEQRRSIYAIYAWCRALDETVDAAGSASDAASLAALRSELSAWQRNITRLWSPGGQGAAATQGMRPEEVALADTIQRVPGLEPAAFSEMVEGMYMDVQPSVRYGTFEELYTYCYRVAGTGTLFLSPFLRRDAQGG
jgi:phytoene synthase